MMTGTASEVPSESLSVNITLISNLMRSGSGGLLPPKQRVETTSIK